MTVAGGTPASRQVAASANHPFTAKGLYPLATHANFVPRMSSPVIGLPIGPADDVTVGTMVAHHSRRSGLASIRQAQRTTPGRPGRHPGKIAAGRLLHKSPNLVRPHDATTWTAAGDDHCPSAPVFVRKA